MVASYYLLKPFYALCWRVLNLFQARRQTVFYCRSAVDMQNWLPVQKYLKPIPLVSDKRSTRSALRKMGYEVKPLPVFPKAVIMCRVSAHKFPSRKVIKIGMTHGAYHFKRMTSAKNYQPFSLYLFTSQADLKIAKERGITCGQVGGYPKLDPYLKNAKAARSEVLARPRVLFTSTYDASGMSAIHLWLERLPELVGKYDIYVSLHPWMHPDIVKQIAGMAGIHFLEDHFLPVLNSVDVCVVDSSSVIAEICALDKAMISWVLAPAARSVPQITSILERCSIRISHFDELDAAIRTAIAHPEKHAAARAQANAIFFDRLDAQAGRRSASLILNLLPELKP